MLDALFLPGAEDCSTHDHHNELFPHVDTNERSLVHAVAGNRTVHECEVSCVHERSATSDIDASGVK